MRASNIGALAACIAASSAFSDTSPFFLFSSEPPSSIQQASSAQIQTAESVLQTTKDFLSSCPSDLYVLIESASQHAGDFTSDASVPHLKRAIRNPGVQTRAVVSEVLGLTRENANEIATYIKEVCEITEARSMTYPSESIEKDILGAHTAGRRLVRASVSAPPLGTTERGDFMADLDARLDSAVLDQLLTGYRYTVIYITTPVEGTIEEDYIYEAPFEYDMHVDLKRDFQMGSSNDTSYSTLPLFEKYQFLTPGIFMGISVSILLLSILAVGFSALGSLEVSYGAFDKENGPAAQQKK